MEASLQVHAMARKLFIKKAAKLPLLATDKEINALKLDCYNIASAFYNR